MNWAIEALRWFSGGQDQYMTLFHCMNHDVVCIALTVSLDLTIAAGYIVIASHWSRNQRNLPDIPAKRALADMRNIFIFCGLCGYIFIPIKMFWPAWRLYDAALMVLAYFTWRYALTASNLKVVYSELGRSTRLAADLQLSQQESQRKSQFLNALSHDLRTPLNGLALQASVAEMCSTQGDADGLKKALADIRNSTRATATLLDTLLDTARADWKEEQNHATRFSLDDLLATVVSGCRSGAAAKSLSMDMSCPKSVVLYTDRIKLERILSNLLANAVKFTHTGGVRIESQRAGNALELHVIDSGVGIGPAEHERLFDEFYQLHNSERDPSKGFGLGLSIARRLARQLGGDISVDSSLGRGSRFSVVLPGVLDSDAQSAESAAIAPATSNPVVIVSPA